MRNFALRKLALSACAAALLHLPLAAAGPVNSNTLVKEVRKGFKDAVKVTAVSESVRSEVIVTGITITSKSNSNRSINIKVDANNQISEKDVQNVASWLQGMTPDKGASAEPWKAIAKLVADATPVDPDFKASQLPKLKLWEFRLPNGNYALFTGVFEQVGQEYSATSSAGEFNEALLDAFGDSAVQRSGDARSVKDVDPSSFDDSLEYANALADALLNRLAKTPSEPDDPNSKPLLQSTDPIVPTVRQGLTHDTLKSWADGVADKISVKRGLRGKSTQQLLLDDLLQVFEAAGVDNVRVEAHTTGIGIFEKTQLTISAGDEIIADGVSVSKSNNGWFLNGAAVSDMTKQLQSKEALSMEGRMDQFGIRGDSPPSIEDVKAVVERTEQPGGGKGPGVSDPTGDPNGTGSPDQTDGGNK